jgi:hypothetical protein
VIVYGHRSFLLDPRAFLTDLTKRLDHAAAVPPHDDLVELLIDVGEAEAGVADSVMPDVDAEADELNGWREIAGAVAAACCASRYRDRGAIAPALHRARSAAERMLSLPVPSSVRARTAEGFACYALYPEQYMDAAEKIVDAGSPHHVFCLGLRSIGSILAHVVAATLQRRGVQATVRSVRPRCHPYDRQLRSDPSLERLVELFPADVFAIVDEGPGLSGSSFAAAADWLNARGVSSERIVLVPSWNAQADRLISARAQCVWNMHRRFVGAYSPHQGVDGLEDLSAGRWRADVFADDPAAWPAVHPHHERTKLLNRSDKKVLRFAGLGAAGKRARTRAAAIADAGFGPPAGEVHDGFLELVWKDGRPAPVLSDAFLRRAAEYIAFIKERFGTGAPEDLDELEHMIDVNSSEAGVPIDIAFVSRTARVGAHERVAVDGRMMPHEWIATESGVLKVDGLDHHADDFFPGCRDIAWDLAGACIEWDLPPHAASVLVSRYMRLSGDSAIEQRLPFYEAAYAAYRLGYAHLAASTLHDAAEATRFRSLENTYANRLRRFQRSA